MNVQKADDSFKILIDAVNKTVNNSTDVLHLRQSIEKCDKKSILSKTDDNGFDVLHHAIKSNNIEAVGMIFALGLFKPPHEPKAHPYLHIAANLGHKVIVSILLQERKCDNKHLMYEWISKPKRGPGSLVDGHYRSRVSPLDVAGDSGHMGCVITILDFYQTGTTLRSETDTHLCRACKCSSPSALRLLLTNGPTEEDVKAAVGSALKLANPECLDVLLSGNPRLTALFGGMNLYHVLYSYSLSFRKEWYESLLTVTSVLLKHRQNPLRSVPFRTYPLYSLLSHSTTTDFGKASPYLIACVVLLLNAGADPNFNEEQFEKEHESQKFQTAFGRSCFASALHCLFDSVGQYAKHAQGVDAIYVRRHLVKCADTLLHHGANPNICGAIEEDGLVGNALHAFLKICMIVGIETKTMGVFHKLLRHGADPDLNVSGKFPVNVFCDEILSAVFGFENIPKSEETEKTDLIKDIAFTLFNVMSHKALLQASAIPFDGKPTNVIQRKVFKSVKDEFSRRTAQIWSLKRLCKLTILTSCGHRETSVVNLPLPPALKAYVVDFSM